MAKKLRQTELDTVDRCFCWYGLLLVMLLAWGVVNMPAMTQRPQLVRPAARRIPASLVPPLRRAARPAQEELEAIHSWYCGDEDHPNRHKDPCIAFRMLKDPLTMKEEGKKKIFADLTGGEHYKKQMDEVFRSWCTTTDRKGKKRNSKTRACRQWSYDKRGYVEL